MNAIASARNTDLPRESRVPTLCMQCKNLAPRLTVPVGVCNERLVVRNGSKCPLCLFFAAIIHGKCSSSTVRTSARFRLLDYQGPSTVGGPRDLSFRNYYVQSEDSTVSRFILPESGQENLRFRTLPKNLIDYPLLRKWIIHCKTYHGDACSHQGKTSQQWAPGRTALKVIDCRSSKIIVASPGAEYVALSYVWGKPSASNKHDSVLSCGTATENLLNLPETIKDAMKVTLKLGYRYLWCDKYCFDQQSDPHQLQSQLSIMAMIYSAAAVTIVAAAGDHSDHGLPGVGGRSRTTPPAIQLNGTTWVAGLDDFKTPIRESPWSQRAWTYQEEFYSRLQLIFTEEQVIFECNTMSCFESVTMEKSSSSTGLFIGRSSAYIQSTWDDPFREHIVRYTKRALSYQSDVLNAMRGLFQSFSTQENPCYQYWGIPYTMTACTEIQSRSRMWSHLWAHGVHLDNVKHQLNAAFCRELCWVVNPETSTKIIRREGFPSWSWAGWIAPVLWPCTSPLTWDNILPVELHVVKFDGTDEPLTEELVKMAFENGGDLALDYTCQLRIVAEILYLRFAHIPTKRRRHSHIFDRPTSTYKDAMYAARGTIEMISGSGERSFEDHEWLLDVTSDVDDELHYSLCHQLFEGIVICKDYVLVTRTRDGMRERIGVMSVRSVDSGERTELHPRLCFPGSRRDIILG